MYDNFSLTLALPKGKWACKRMFTCTGQYSNLAKKTKKTRNFCPRTSLQTERIFKEVKGHSALAQYLLKSLFRKTKGSCVPWQRPWRMAACLLSWWGSSSSCGVTAGRRPASPGRPSTSSATRRHSRWHQLLNSWILLQQPLCHTQDSLGKAWLVNLKKWGGW